MFKKVGRIVLGVLLLYILCSGGVLAGSFTPYILLQAEHGDLSGDIKVNSLDGIGYVTVMSNKSKNQLSIPVDIYQEDDYEIWVRVSGTSLIEVNMYNKDFKQIVHQPTESSHHNWHWVKINLDQKLSPERYYLVFENFSNAIRIDKIIFQKKDWRGQINNLSQESTGVTTYSTMSTSSVGDSPELNNASPWDSQGLNPFATLLQNGQEYVSVTSGLLIISATDLVIPGRNGMDLRIGRSYTSKASDKDSYGGATELIDDWTFAFPKIYRGKVFFPNGSICDLNSEDIVQQAEELDNGDKRYTYTNVINRYFQLTRYETNTGNILGVPQYDIQNYTVYLPDGTTYYFDFEGKITQIKDRTGENTLQFTYNSGLLQTVTDTIGRVFTFERSSTGINVVRQSDGKKMVAYGFENNKLKTVTDAEGNIVTYSYSAPGITQVKYPSGKVSKYIYTTDTYEDSVTDAAGDIHSWSYDLYWVRDHKVYVTNEENILELVKERSFQYYFEDKSKRDIFFTKVETFDENNILILRNYYFQDEYGMVNWKKTIDEVKREVIRTTYTEYGANKEKRIESIYHGNISDPNDSYIINPYILENPDIAVIGDSPSDPIISSNLLTRTDEYLLTQEKWEYDQWGNMTYHKNPEGYETMIAYANTPDEATFYRLGNGNALNGGFYDNSVLNNTHIHNLPSGKLTIRRYFGEYYEEFEAKELYFKYDGYGNLEERKNLDVGENNLQKWTNHKYLNYDQYGNCWKEIYDADSVDPIEITYEFGPVDYGYPYIIAKTQYISKNLVDDNGILKSPEYVTTTYQYDMQTGNQIKIIDSRNKYSEFIYDNLGRLVKKIYPKVSNEIAPVYEEVIYEDENNLVKSYDAERKKLTVQYYDGLGRKTKVEIYSDLAGTNLESSEQFTYNWQSKVKRYINPDDKVAIYEYDLFGRNKLVQTHDGNITETIYDDLNRTTTTIDPKLHTKVITKDRNGQIIKVEVQNKEQILISTYEYDGYGNLVKSIDAKNQQVAYDYNNKGQLVGTKYANTLGKVYDRANHPRNLTTFNYYDAKGHLSQTIDRNGNAISYDYNEYNQLIRMDLANEDDINYYYNEIGQLVKVKRGNQFEKLFVYDERGRALQEKMIINPGMAMEKTYTTGYDYNKNNLLMSINYPANSGTLNYGYNELGQVNNLKWNGSNYVDSVSYTNTGHISTMEYGNGVMGQYHYNYVNGQYFPGNIAYHLGDKFLGVYDYKYDRMGNMIKSNNHSYEYDDLGQLTDWNFLKDHDRVLLGEKVIWEKSMNSQSDIALFHSSVTDDQLQLSIEPDQSVIHVSKLISLSELEPENLIINFSFEDSPIGSSGIPTGWLRNIYDTDISNLRIVTDSSGYGNKAIELDNTKYPESSSLNLESKDISVIAGERYRQSGWLKGTGTARLYLGRAWYDSVGNRISYNYIATGVNPSQWTYYEEIVTAPQGAVKCRIWLINYKNNTGIGYFDNLSFIKSDGNSDVVINSTQNINISLNQGIYLYRRGHEYVTSFTNNNDWVNLAKTDAVINNDLGIASIPQRPESERWVPVVQEYPQLQLDKNDVKSVSIGLGTVTAKHRYSGADYISHPDGWKPEPYYNYNWHLVTSSLSISSNVISDVKTLNLKLYNSLNNSWSFFGGWGNWTMWEMVKINGKYVGMKPFRTNTKEFEYQTQYLSVNLQEKGLMNQDLDVKMYYLVSKWGTGSTTGGYINSLTATGTSKFYYPVNQSKFVNYRVSLEAGARYKLETTQTLPSSATTIRYELWNGMIKVQSLLDGRTFSVGTSGSYTVRVFVETTDMNQTPIVHSISVLQEQLYKGEAIVELNPVVMPAKGKIVQFKPTQLMPVGTTIIYRASNDGGTTWVIPRYDVLNQQYIAEFPYLGDRLILKAFLKSPSYQKTPQLSNIQVTGVDFGDYASNGEVKIKNISVPFPALQLILEVHGLKNDGDFDILMNVNGKSILGVLTSAKELVKDGTVGDLNTTDSEYSLIEQADLLRTEISGKNLQNYYYKFELPVDLRDSAFTADLKFTLKSNSDNTKTPYIYSYILLSNNLSYYSSGFFNNARDLSVDEPYTFDQIRLDVTENKPIDTSISYLAYNYGSSTEIVPGTLTKLGREISSLRVKGTLQTTNHKSTPKITDLRLTAIGETPLESKLESVSDVYVTTSGTLSLSSEGVVGTNSLLVDHTNVGYGYYAVKKSQVFDATKLPIVQMWVKPLTDHPIAFASYDVSESRYERITNDSDADAYFEVGVDLVKNQWNLVVLDLRKTKGGGIAKDAKGILLIVDQQGTKLLFDGVSSLPLNEAKYDYDAVGNRVSYKESGILTTSPNSGIETIYEYELGSNRLTRVFTINAQNELLEESNFIYDANGNLISKDMNNYKNGTYIFYNYVYNERNQMEEFWKNGTLVEEYRYDHNGLRYMKVNYLTNQTTIYIYGKGTEPIYEEIYNDTMLTTVEIQNSYLFMGAKRIAKVNGQGTSYYFSDHLGSTRIVTGAENGTYDYKPFGGQFASNGAERYTFTGKEDDGTSGFSYYNARYYDSVIGRFVSEDPAKDGINWYVYTANNPLKYLDMGGLKKKLATNTFKHTYTKEDFANTGLLSLGKNLLTSWFKKDVGWAIDSIGGSVNAWAKSHSGKIDPGLGTEVTKIGTLSMLEREDYMANPDIPQGARYVVDVEETIVYKKDRGELTVKNSTYIYIMVMDEDKIIFEGNPTVWDGILHLYLWFDYQFKQGSFYEVDKGLSNDAPREEATSHEIQSAI